MKRILWIVAMLSMSAWALDPEPCTIQDWKSMVRSALRSSSTLDLSRCTEAGAWVNADLGFGQRALHHAVFEGHVVLVNQLLEFPNLQIGLQNDDDRSAVHYVLIDDSERWTDELIDRMVHRLLPEELRKELVLLAKECVGTPVQMASFKAKRMGQLIPNEDRPENLLVDILAGLVVSEATCFSDGVPGYSIQFLREYYPMMIDQEKRFLELRFFDFLQEIDSRRIRMNLDVGFFPAFLKHPSLDRHFPAQEDRQEQDRYALRAFAAARLGDRRAMDYLVQERGFPVNFQTTRGDATLFHALYSEDEAFLIHYLSYPGVDVSLTHDGKNLIYWAAFYRKALSTVRVIVRAAKSQGVLQNMVESEDEKGVNLLEYLVQWKDMTERSDAKAYIDEVLALLETEIKK